jgi:archaellum component FlaF (FlaF/FlaG flagellin family)
MEKLREIKLPTLHAKEWATIAITAFLTVVSTLYVTFRTTNTAIDERNEKEKDPISNDIEENFKT